MDTEDAAFSIHPRPAAYATKMGTTIGRPPNLGPGDDRLVGPVTAVLMHLRAPDEPGMNIARLTLGKAEGIAVLIWTRLLLRHG